MDQLVAVDLGQGLGEEPFAGIDLKPTMLDHVAGCGLDLAVWQRLGLHALDRSVGDFKQLLRHCEIAEFARLRVLRRKPVSIFDNPAPNSRLWWHVVGPAYLPKRLSIREGVADTIG